MREKSASSFLKVFCAFLVTLCGNFAWSQTLLAGWTFDATTGKPYTPTSISANLGVYSSSATLYADGTNGSSTWSQSSELDALSGSTTNDPRSSTTAGQAYSLVAAASLTANGKSIVFKLPTTGYRAIKVSFATYGSSTGFNSQQWAYSTDGMSFTNFGTNTATNSASYTTNNLDLTAVTAVNNVQALYLRLTVSGATNGLGSNRIDNILITSDNSTWFGTTNTAYSTASNWIPGGIKSNFATAPASGANINFQGSLSNQPSIGSTAVSIGDLSYNAGTGNVDFSGSAMLTINGNIFNNSSNAETISVPVKLGAASAQTIDGNSGITFTTLTLSNTHASGVTLNTLVNVTDSLLFKVSNAKLYTNGNLLLKSSATGTARVTDLTNNGANSGNSIIGNVTVERYLPARRAWKLLTSPVRGAGTVYGNWQNNGTADDTTGVEIWGPGGNPSINGLVNSSGSYSMLKYDALNNVWTNVTNTKTEVLSSSTGSNNGGAADNKAFMLFATGPFGSNKIDPATGAAATVLRATGTLQTGDQLVPLSASQSFSLFPNPYASPIDFSKLISDAGNSTVINDYFWTWDASTAGSGNYGTYKLIFHYINNNSTPKINEYRVLPYDPINGLNNPNTADPAADLRHIQSGQAVFLYKKGTGSGSVTVRESFKSAPTTSPAIFRMAGIARTAAGSSQDLSISLYKNNNVLDGALIKMDNAFSSAVVDDEDIAKPWNTYENFALYSGGKVLMLESRPLPAGNESFNFLLYNLVANQPYKLVVSAENLSLPGLMAYLEDSYAHTSTQINSTGLTEVNFTASNDPATLDVQRFRVIFAVAAPLPVGFTDVKAARLNGGVNVEWTSMQELNTLRYEVEKSTDGINFVTAAQAPAKNTGSKAMYEWFDNQPAENVNYYRIKAVHQNGEGKYSPIVKVFIGDAQTHGVLVYPNPVAAKQATLQISLPKGEYALKVYTASGQLLLQQTLLHTGGTSSTVVQLPSNITKGMYQVTLSGNGSQHKAAFVIQ